MTLKTILGKHRNLPIEQSIGPVAAELAKAPVLVAAHAPVPDDVQFQVAKDAQGLLWIYAFSDESEVSRALPAGASFVLMNFADVLATIGPDDRFGGVFIDSKSDAMYVIPRELFAFVYHSIADAQVKK